MVLLHAALDPILARSFSRLNGTGTEALSLNHRTITTLGVFQAMKGRRDFDDLLRAIPDALRPLLVFDRVTVSLDRDAGGAPRRYVVEGDLGDLDAQSVCTAPLAAPQRALGTLEIAARRADAYSQDDARLLAAIAEEIAVPLDNALSHEQLREGHNRLALLLELTNSLVSNLELRDVLKTVMGSARRVMRSDSAVVALPHADGRYLRAYALDCAGSRDALEGHELIYGEATVSTHVFRTGKP